MNGSVDLAVALCTAIRHESDAWPAVEIAVCPSFTLLPTARQALLGGRVQLGAQDVGAHEQGAFTGQVSAAMLLEQGCRYVIVGHSERRLHCGESDQTVAAKVGIALRHRLRPIVCIGETRLERERGETEAVIRRQASAVFRALEAPQLSAVVVAYEPVWAVGTGLTAAPAQAQAVHAQVRQLASGQDAHAATAMRIIYGGSMQPDNAAALLAQPDIDGGLVGAAALHAEQFAAICRAAGRRYDAAG